MIIRKQKDSKLGNSILTFTHSYATGLFLKLDFWSDLFCPPISKFAINQEIRHRIWREITVFDGDLKNT